MKIRILLLQIVIALLLPGCQQPAGSGQVTQTYPAMPTETASSLSPTTAFTPEATPTRTPTATATPQPSATPRFPPDAKMQFNCLNILPVQTEWVESRGVVVLENALSRQIEDYLLDMSTGEFALVNKGGEGGIDFAASPDRNWFAYNRFLLEGDRSSQNELIIANATGQVEIAIPWEEGWTGIPGWLDNKWLVINISGLDPLENAHRKPAHLLALNPFTGERKILAPDFPDIHTFDMFDWAGWSRTMYDPSLTRVVYLTEYDNFSFVLWDLENGQEITRLPAVFPMWRYIPIPRWTPDGTRFVVEAWIPAENRLELFQVSHDGEIEQLTNLYAYGDATLTGLSWSPDGRYLAGWLDTSLGEDPELELIMLDTHTQQITNYCLQVRYFGEGFSGIPKEPIWSPDGTQLLVMDILDQGHRQVMLVDLTQGFAAQIAEDMEPVGWMLAP